MRHREQNKKVEQEKNPKKEKYKEQGQGQQKNISENFPVYI